MNARGMTLIEVMVALAVFGIAMLAVLDSSSQNIRSLSYLEQRTLAGWIADNLLVEAHLNKPTKDGQQKGTRTQAEQTWYWRQTVQAAAYPGLKRIDVEVRASQEGEPLAIASTFIGG